MTVQKLQPSFAPAEQAAAVPVSVAFGDGIGPEIMDVSLRVLAAAGARLDIEQIDTLFDDMKNASQFGKLVVTLGAGKASKI